MKNPIKFKTAINLALQKAFKKDKDVLLMGLGVGDPKNIFETTEGLQKKFGKKRVFDVPCSENALTGICIGYGIKKKAILTHQRFDFMLLSFDQIINNAAKMHFMYGGNLQSKFQKEFRTCIKIISKILKTFLFFSTIIILEPDDIILSDIRTTLYFYKFQWNFSWI